VEVGTASDHIAALAFNDSDVVVGRSDLHPILAQGAHARALSLNDGIAEAITKLGAISGIMNPLGQCSPQCAPWQLRIWDAAGERSVPLPTRRLGGPKVLAMNSRGDVLVVDSIQYDVFMTGAHEDSITDMVSFLFRDGQFQKLSSLHPLYRSTFAAALNDQGQAVGMSAVGHKDSGDSPYDGSQNVFHPFLWKDGVLQDLGVFGRSDASCTLGMAPRSCASGAALGLNNRGWVVGYSENDAMIKRPFVWHDGVMSEIDAFPGDSAFARLINDQGVVAGDNDREAFLWDNGRVTVLGSLGGVALRVTAIDQRGDVAGTGFAADGTQHAFVWRNGQMIDLGIPIPGGCAAQPLTINEKGEVLITVLMQYCAPQWNTPLSFMGYAYVQRAVIWHPPSP
jgi:probable HAF family extracellular repeat protein